MECFRSALDPSLGIVRKQSAPKTVYDPSSIIGKELLRDLDTSNVCDGTLSEPPQTFVTPVEAGCQNQSDEDERSDDIITAAMEAKESRAGCQNQSDEDESIDDIITSVKETQERITLLSNRLRGGVIDPPKDLAEVQRVTQEVLCNIEALKGTDGGTAIDSLRVAASAFGQRLIIDVADRVEVQYDEPDGSSKWYPGVVTCDRNKFKSCGGEILVCFEAGGEYSVALGDGGIRLRQDEETRAATFANSLRIGYLPFWDQKCLLRRQVPFHLTSICKAGSTVQAAIEVEKVLLALGEQFSSCLRSDSASLSAAAQKAQRLLEVLERKLVDLRGQLTGVWPRPWLVEGQAVLVQRREAGSSLQVGSVSQIVQSKRGKGRVADIQLERMVERVPEAAWETRVRAEAWPFGCGADDDSLEEAEAEAAKAQAKARERPAKRQRAATPQ